MAKKRSMASKVLDGVARGFGAGIGYKLANGLMTPKTKPTPSSRRASVPLRLSDSSSTADSPSRVAYDVEQLESRGTAVAREQDVTPRVLGMKTRIQVAIWKYALSHGECATMKQISDLKIFPARENSKPIEYALATVNETLGIFFDTGSLSQERMESLSVATVTIERHLAGCMGTSILPGLLERGASKLTRIAICVLGAFFFLLVGIFLHPAFLALSLGMSTASLVILLKVVRLANEAKRTLKLSYASPLKVMGEIYKVGSGAIV